MNDEKRRPKNSLDLVNFAIDRKTDEYRHNIRQTREALLSRALVLYESAYDTMVTNLPAAVSPADMTRAFAEACQVTDPNEPGFLAVREGIDDASNGRPKQTVGKLAWLPEVVRPQPIDGD